MLIALPQALMNLKELAGRKQARSTFTLEFLSEFLNGLSVLGVERYTIYMLRRDFELLGAQDYRASSELDRFKDRLGKTDKVLGAELGGLGNLFCSLMAEQEVFTGEKINFDGLEESLKSELEPLGRASQQIFAASDIAVAAQAPVHRVAACISLGAISDWISSSAVGDFLGEHRHLDQIANLYRFRPKLEDLRAEFVQNILAEEDVRDFAIWYLAHNLTSGQQLEPLQRRLVATLLNRALLPKLERVERAFESRP